jgi:carbon-monoxide dehydrogenase medium subunit
MKPAPFSYSAARSSEAAVEALADTVAPRILAGGQSLVPMLNLRLAPADAVLDITRIPELRAIEVGQSSIRYGALTTHAAFEDGTVPDGANGLMQHVASHIAYRAVRCRGTIGGALALADPAADWLTTVIVLEGTVHIVSKAGRRSVPAHEFVLGPYFSSLSDGDLIESIEIPKRPPTERWGYHKVVVKVGEYAKSMALTLWDPNRSYARVVLGAIDGVPLVLGATAAATLRGSSDKEVSDEVRRELIGSGRDFSPAQLILHSTTVVRSIKDAASK